MMKARLASLVLAAGLAAGSLGLAASYFANSPQQPAEPVFQILALPSGDTIAVSAREVTWAEWKACFDARGCTHLPRESEALRGKDYPVTGISYFDAQDYLAWINAQAGHRYRLPTAGEWKMFAADLPQPTYKKLFDDPRLAWAADYGAMKPVSPQLQASGSFGALSNGIADLRGNVWEWTSTCVSTTNADKCAAYFVEGQHESVISIFIREPASGGCAAGIPPAHVGLRLVHDIAEIPSS